MDIDKIQGLKPENYAGHSTKLETTQSDKKRMKAYVVYTLERSIIIIWFCPAPKYSSVVIYMGYVRIYCVRSEGDTRSTVLVPSPCRCRAHWVRLG